MRRDFLLGDWLVQPQRDCIQRGEEVVHLKPKAMGVLACLARTGGRVVTRLELFERVWPGAAVGDATLTQCIVELRHAFGDDARNPRIIETIPRVGFRLIPPVDPVDPDGAAEPVNGRGASAGGGSARRLTFRRKPHAWIATALATFALGALVYGLHSRGAQDAAFLPAQQSIAVLPFSDLSQNASQAWLAQGMAEDLRASLIRLHGLQVAGGVSSSRFNGEPDDPEAVAEALGVRYLLLGSVMQEDQRLRVTSRLVDASTGFHIWSEVFDRPRADLFAVRAEISESVAVALSITLGVGELGAAPGGTKNIEAFELRMRGRELYETFTGESITEAIALLNRAVELDPNYAEAWAWLATLCYLAPMAFEEPPPVDFLSLSQNALDRARALEPDLAAVLPVAIDLHSARREWLEVERMMSEASEANLAFSPKVHFSYGIFLMHMGRAREALTRLLHARRLEPLAPFYGSKLGHAYVLNGRLDEALAEHERVWALDEGNRYFQSTDGLIAALAARDPEVVARWLGRVVESASPEWEPYFSTLQQEIEDRTAASDWLRRHFERGMFADYWIAVFAAYFGDTTLALEALLRSPDGYALWTPLMAEVRREPEFREVVRRLGLPAYWRAYTWADFCQPSGPEDFVCE